jgi:ubiquitin fusion degradation protein 1
LVPLWILKQLRINSGENVAVQYLARPLEKGHFAKFEPLSKNFLDITDPKTVLEHCMRMYVCISRHDLISIYYNRQVYELRITETLPDDTISIVDTDLEVDFDQIKGEKEENMAINLPEDYDLEKIQSESNNNSFRLFSGVGQRLDDKPILPGNSHQTSIQKNDSNGKRCKSKAIPDYDYKICTIQFKRYKKDLIPSVDSIKPERLSLKSSAQKQQSTSSEQMSQIQSQPQRPFTRSQAAMLCAQGNPANSNQMSTNSTNTQQNQSNDSNTNGLLFFYICFLLLCHFFDK